jgi:hypothetical protein
MTYGLEGRRSIQLSYGRQELHCACAVLVRLRRPLALAKPARACLSVGALGFEPRASCSQSRRATGLRYAPLIVK